MQMFAGITNVLWEKKHTKQLLLEKNNNNGCPLMSL